MLKDALKRVAVLGAAGKMGSGISLLLLQEMTRQESEELGSAGEGGYTLYCIDANEAALSGLRHYLRDQLRRYAERNINSLRQNFAKNPALASNEEMINAFVEGALDNVRFETETLQAKNASLIFEAIVEDIAIKAKEFAAIEAATSNKPFYFTNTSSIPIGVLSQKSGISSRIMGFHFYNPPAVQRLLEIITADNTDARLVNYAIEISKRFEKVSVFSKDVAGFIGNGHFMREIDFACRKVREFEKQHSRKEAIWMLNRVTHEFLIRPMGIFQLLDYIGWDVGQKVLNVMSTYLKIPFEKTLIESLISQGIRGGQNPDGSQKDGIFKYEGGRIVKMWDAGSYVELSRDALGSLPPGHSPWKALQKDKQKNDLLETYLHNLFAANSPGALLAQEFLQKSREIARHLVADGVAKTKEDIETVLKNGFYHLYSPLCDWIPEEVKGRRG